MSSLRSIIAFAFIITVLLVVISIATIVLLDVRQSVREAEESHVIELLDKTYKRIEDSYKGYQFYQNSLLQERKKTMLRSIEIVDVLIQQVYQNYRNGKYDEKTAKKIALEQIRRLRFNNDKGYFWIQAEDVEKPTLLMHPTLPHLENISGEANIYYEAMNMEKNLLVELVEQAESSEDKVGYAQYNWAKPTEKGLTEMQPKISCVKVFEPWKWVIGTGEYIDDIQKESENHWSELKHLMFASIKNTTLNQHGYFYIFKGDYELLVHPSLMGYEAEIIINPLSGNKILDDVKSAVNNPDGLIKYEWDNPHDYRENKFLKYAYVRYFAPLDWYIVASVYEADLNSLARKLSYKILVVATIFLLISILVAWYVSRKIAKPIMELANDTNKISFSELDKSKIRVKGTTETKDLAINIRKMIHKLHEEEELLKKNEERYRTIFNAGNEAIFVHEANTGKILDVNNTMLKMFGYQKSEVIGKGPSFFSDDNYQNSDEAQKNITKAIKKGSHTFEWKSKKKNGEIFWSEVSLTYSKLADEKRILAVVRDIDERKRSKEMMIQSEKMLSVGGLAAGMAHEINNPISGMLQTASVVNERLTNLEMKANVKVAKDLGVSLPDVRKFIEARNIPQMLARIKESGNNAAEIVRNMLSFSRKSNSLPSMNKIDVLLDNIINLAASDYDLKKNYDFKQIKIIRKYDENLPEVECEASKIQQVLFNILRNGAEAMWTEKEENPDIIKEPTFILSLRYLSTQEMIEIKISDNGPGMAEDVRKRIFEPFYTTKPTDKGTGLGLSVGYFIITDDHRGELYVNSALGRGATFIIKLPIMMQSPKLKQ